MVNDLDILLPVHNEAKSIASFIENIDKSIRKKIKYRFLICEDGSTDGTKDVLKKIRKKFKINLITEAKRKGFSKAVQDGIKKSTAKYLLIMDSDGQCDHKKILSLWYYRNNFDLINAYRIKRVDFAYRRFYSQVCYFIYKILFSVPLRDPSFGFIMMNKKVYKSLDNYKILCPDGFFWEFNARAKIKGYTFKEIPIFHIKRKFGVTKIYTYFNLPKIALTHLIGLLKIKFGKDA